MQHFTLSHPSTVRWNTHSQSLTHAECSAVQGIRETARLYSRWYRAVRPLKGTACQGPMSLNSAMQALPPLTALSCTQQITCTTKACSRNSRSRTFYSESSLSFGTPSLPVVHGESIQRSFWCSCRKCSARCRCKGRQDPFAGVFMAFV